MKNMADIANVKKTAKCYYVRGSWRYYRTKDGETFSVRDGKYYFHHGNVFNDEKQEVKFIDGENLKELKKRYDFIDV